MEWEAVELTLWLRSPGSVAVGLVGVAIPGNRGAREMGLDNPPGSWPTDSGVD